MDCQKFDEVVMDALYEELDELTSAALRRHVESCSRCGDIWGGLRTTREGAILPLEEPSPSLEERILHAVSDAQRTTPWHRKALRALAWAGSHAMRPQLAMAALFVLVIGSSLLLLRARPGTVGISPVRVTERGVPTPDESDLPHAAAEPALPPMDVAPTSAAAAAEGAERSKHKDDVERRAEDSTNDENKNAQQDANDAAKALADARAKREGTGCNAAVQLYDAVNLRFPGTPQAADAMWEAAQCEKSLGNTSRARELFSALKASDGYKARAEEALQEDATGTTQVGSQLAARTRAASTPPTAAPNAGKPAPAAPAENQVDKVKAAPGGGPGRNVNAAPKRSQHLDTSDAAY